MLDGPVAPPAVWEKAGSPFQAQHPGTCPDCGEVIVEGNAIQRWDRGDEQTAYLHIGCVP